MSKTRQMFICICTKADGKVVLHKALGGADSRHLIPFPSPVYPFARAAITEYHKLGGLDNRHLVSHSSGGRTSKMKELTGLVSSEDCKAKSVPGLSHSFW